MNEKEKLRIIINENNDEYSICENGIDFNLRFEKHFRNFKCFRNYNMTGLIWGLDIIIPSFYPI